MNSYKKVLVPLDGFDISEKIIPEVEKIIDKNVTQIHVIRIVTPMHRVPDFNTAEYDALMIEDAEKYIREIEYALKKEGYSVQGFVRNGLAADEIIKHCEENPDIELIAMSTHGRSGAERWLLGSVAEKVLRHAARPVFLVRPAKK